MHNLYTRDADCACAWTKLIDHTHFIMATPIISVVDAISSLISAECAIILWDEVITERKFKFIFHNLSDFKYHYL